MAEPAAPTRLVTFLGTGSYQPVIYRDAATGESANETRWMAHALADLVRPSDILVLETAGANAKNGEALRTDLAAAGLTARFCPVDEGGAPAQLWQQFEAIKAALRAPAGTAVVLDITHGFRAQPFFAAAVVAFVRAVDPEPAPLRVVYGAYEARDTATNVAPVWEFTPFVDLLDLTREIMLFLRTGRAAGVAAYANRLDRERRKGFAGLSPTERQDLDALRALAKALNSFGQDLETVRTGALLLGDGNHPGSARRLADRAAAARDSVATTLPPLADVLDRIARMAEPLAGADGRLNTPDGHDAVAALARLYVDLGRHAEAATTVREGLVTLYSGDAAARPGLKGFDMRLREEAEGAFQSRDRDLGRQVAGPRNDIDHGGFRARPLAGADLAKQIAGLVDSFATATARPAAGHPPLFVNISNHPSADWSDAQRAAALALAPGIVDVAFPDVDPAAGAETLRQQSEALLAAVPEGTTHAMVQGEFCLAFALVRALQRRGVKCLAATTSRDVADLGDGSQSRRFSFTGFRPYLD